MACPVLARDDGEWIVSMGHPAWMRWVAGWVIASIGCWMKKTTGGNRPNTRRAGTAHARHRARLFLRLPVEWSDQCLLGGSRSPSRPSRDGSPCSHHRQRWSRHHRHQAFSPIRLCRRRMTPGPTMTTFAWIADRAAHPVNHRLIYHRRPCTDGFATHHRQATVASLQAAAAIEQLLALLPSAQQSNCSNS